MTALDLDSPADIAAPPARRSNPSAPLPRKEAR